MNERTSAIIQREQELDRREANLQRVIDSEAQQVVALREQDLQLEIEKLDASLREKTRENRRLQENFNTLKSANEMLKKQVCELQKVSFSTFNPLIAVYILLS